MVAVEVDIPVQEASVYSPPPLKDEPELLSEQILSQQGSYQRVKRYFRGWHPELGKLHYGWQGKETIVEKGVIKAARQVSVVSREIPILRPQPNLTFGPPLFPATRYLAAARRLI